MNWYRIKTSFIGLKRLATLPEEDKQACVDAYKFFQRMQAGEKTEHRGRDQSGRGLLQGLEQHVLDLRRGKALHPATAGRIGGLVRESVVDRTICVEGAESREPWQESHLLDMGCGRGRISYHFATLTGGQVSGYNIDSNQIESAIDWATECEMSDRLHFKVGNHHEPLEYESGTFDGCYSFGAVWPFFKKEELDAHAREMYRVLKPRTRYSCSEYLLSPSLRLGQRRTRDALHKSLPPNSGCHSVDVSRRRVCRAGKSWDSKSSSSAPSKRRSLASLRAEARPDSLWVDGPCEVSRRFAFCLHGSTSRLIYFKKVAKPGRLRKKPKLQT